jgi:hypothetical protein
MSDHAFEFLQSWTVENVKPTLYEDGETPEHLADDCAWEAKTIGIIKSDLIKAAGGDLKGFMLAQFNPAVHCQAKMCGPTRPAPNDWHY